MSPYREPWYFRVFDAVTAVLDAGWPYALAVTLVVGWACCVSCAVDVDAANAAERRANLTTEARSWSTAVGFQVVGVYCYGDAVCDVSVGSAESMRVLYLHCVPGEGCVPR